MLRWMMRVALSLLVSFPSWSADFDKGLAAAERGDYATALREWHPLAEQGHAKAQFNLRVMYADGEGIQQDYGQAVEWYRRAAKQGYAMAQYNLGVMYANGRGVAQDYGQAIEWYRRAAKQGYAEAQNNLGVMYGNGRGVVQNYVTAHMWGNIARANGNDIADEWLDALEQLMSKDQIARAQQRASDCLANQYKNC
jgi:TPR repeat protein